MKPTRLKRGYTWELNEERETVILADKAGKIEVDRVGIYSLAAFLLRVLRRSGRLRVAGERANKRWLPQQGENERP